MMGKLNPTDNSKLIVILGSKIIYSYLLKTLTSLTVTKQKMTENLALKEEEDIVGWF